MGCNRMVKLLRQNRFRVAEEEVSLPRWGQHGRAGGPGENWREDEQKGRSYPRVKHGNKMAVVFA